ncbi:GNAT family N-acetyltransferase [Gottschalkia acidurici]|nr:GNAT family N-acetyltransferase [Gottschalkia acidurici]
MNHLGTVQIETDRLILRKFDISDLHALFNNWGNDIEVTKFLTWPTIMSVETAESILSNWVDSYADKKFYQWAIVLKENGDEPIGTINVVHMNEEIGMVHIGYCIGRNWWNKGIASEAFKGIIQFLIERVEVKRIESRHDPRNPSSGKVMLKCGLKFEGTLRNADINNQGICDASMYSLLKEDYYSFKE